MAAKKKNIERATRARVKRSSVARNATDGKPAGRKRVRPKPAKGKGADRGSAASNRVARKQIGVAESDAARIIAAIKQIPRGRVCTYGNVADVAGLPRRARLVGTVLRQTPASKSLPWYRVINASGRISFPRGSDGYARQRQLLEKEGVDFVGGRVDLDRYGWPSRHKMLDELLWGPT